MKNIRLITLLEDKNRTEADNLVIKSIYELVEKDISLDVFIRHRIKDLVDTEVVNKYYGMNDITVDILKVMPEYTTYPMLFGRDEDVDTIIYKTDREGRYVIVRNGKYCTDSKDIRLLQVGLYLK